MGDVLSDTTPVSDFLALDATVNIDLDSSEPADVLDCVPGCWDGDESAEADLGLGPEVSYECPAAPGGKKGAMPECPYYLPFLFDNGAYFTVYQLTRWEPGILPGLPEGFTPVGGQVLGLVRARWVDPWAEGGICFEFTHPCSPDVVGCKGCGGHCFLPTNFVWVVDMNEMSLVYAAKEPYDNMVYSVLNQCEEYTGPNYCLRFEDIGRRLAVLTGVYDPIIGTDNYVPGTLQVLNLNELAVLKNISVPLF